MESVCRPKPTVGSNPTLSANPNTHKIQAVAGGDSFSRSSFVPDLQNASGQDANYTDCGRRRKDGPPLVDRLSVYQPRRQRALGGGVAEELTIRSDENRFRSCEFRPVRYILSPRQLIATDD